MRINGYFKKTVLEDGAMHFSEVGPSQFKVDAGVLHLEEIPPEAIIMERATPIETKDGAMLAMPEILKGITGKLIFIPEPLTAVKHDQNR